MGDRTDVPSAPSGQSLFGVMPEVVKGLSKQPALLFGIGAAIVLVAVLAATTSVWLVLIVAAVLVLALGAWLVNEAGRRRGPKIDVNARRAKIGASSVGTSNNGGNIKVDAEGAEITGSDVGTSSTGSGRSKPSAS